MNMTQAPAIGTQVRIGKGKAVWTVAGPGAMGGFYVRRPNGQVRDVNPALLRPVVGKP